MKSSKTRVFALMLSVSMLLGPCGALSAAGPAVSVSSAVSAVKTHNGDTIYGLTVSVYSPNGVSVMSTVMSYDKTVVVPVDRDTLADMTDLHNQAHFRALDVALKDRSGVTPYSMMCFWYGGTSRDAFLCDLYSTEPVTSMTSAQPAYRFLFRLAAGKTSADFSGNTFRIETDKSEGSILASIYKTPEALAGSSGLAVTDKAAGGDTTHSYSPGAGDTGDVLDMGVTLIAGDGTAPQGTGGAAGGQPVGSGSAADAPPLRFDDVRESDWYYDAVMFLAKRGITKGTSATTFSPSDPLTRGQLLVLIMRAFGIEPDEGIAGNFDDAGNTYYTGYLAAARLLGIADGIGNNAFAPQRACTRQEMFKLVYGALKAIGKLPEAKGVKRVEDFADSGDIADWALESIRCLVSGGLVSGTGGGRLEPLSGSNRAEMAQLLANLLNR